MAEERRIVTVLFADIAGTTMLGEARDPEDVQALQTRYYNIAREVVGAHGGSVQALPGRDGRGTLIRITLPLLQPHPADDPDDS